MVAEWRRGAHQTCIGACAAGLSWHPHPMAAWHDFEAAAPELASAARTLLDAHKHKTIATLRKDGSPRISGIEAHVIEGELWFGSMPKARKALDLLRDPRFALHSGSEDPPAWTGDAKVSGRAEEVTDRARVEAIVAAMGGAPPGPLHLFRAELTEVSTVCLGDPADHLDIEVWREGEPVRQMRR